MNLKALLMALAAVNPAQAADVLRMEMQHICRKIGKNRDTTRRNSRRFLSLRARANRRKAARKAHNYR